MLNGGRPPLMVFLLLHWPTRKLRLLWSLCTYQQICILIYLFFIICQPTDPYTASTWIVRNKLEPWTLQHNLSTSDDLVNIYIVHCPSVLVLLMIYEINHIWTAEMRWKWRNDRRSECNLCNCVREAWKNFRTSTWYEPVTWFFFRLLYVIA